MKIKAVLKCPFQGWEKLAGEESLAIRWLCAVRLFSWTPTSFFTTTVSVDILFGINHRGGMSHEGIYAFIILSVD